LKGKKFDAAEKYFQEKQVKLRQEVRQHKEWFAEVSNVNSQLVKENEQLRRENADIKEKYEKLLELSKLSENDIKTALRKNDIMDQFSLIFRDMSRYLFIGVYQVTKKRFGRIFMFKGYCFMPDGFHTPAVELENEEAAVRYAMLQKDIQHEVRIVDESDFTVLQTIKGEVVFPTKEMCGK
jgi:hypothetical protein